MSGDLHAYELRCVSCFFSCVKLLFKLVFHIDLILITILLLPIDVVLDLCLDLSCSIRYLLENSLLILLYHLSFFHQTTVFARFLLILLLRDCIVSHQISFTLPFILSSVKSSSDLKHLLLCLRLRSHL